MSAITLAHVSDPHFGAHDPAVAEALAGALRDARPDLVLVGGDFTQRARRGQYAAARAWLERIGLPYLATPGNHDIPLYDVLRRMRDPYGRYRAQIAPALDGEWRAPGALVAAVCTASPRRRVEGRVEPIQVERLAATLAEPEEPCARVLLTHHPLVTPPGQRERSFHGREELLEAAAAGGADLLLSGHRHVAHTGAWLHTTPSGREMVALWEPTACSSRLRGEANGFATIGVDADRIEITPWRLAGERFAPGPARAWARSGDGWAEAGEAAQAAASPGPLAR